MSSASRTFEGVEPRARSATLTFVWEHAWSLVVWTAMFGWAFALAAIARDDFQEYRYLRFDLGNMTQAVWSTAHGRPLEMTDSMTGDQVSRLAFHVDPILTLLAPAWVLAPSPMTLMVAQIVACALGALPVFWLARRHLGSERTAGVLALAYLLSPWLAWNALEAIHPVTFAIPLILFAIWFLDSDRLLAFAVCATLAALCGELIGVTLAALGLWYWLSRGRRRAGLVIAIACVAWSVVAIYAIVPHYAYGHSIYYSHFEAVGGSPQGVLRTAVSDPGAILAAVTSGRDVTYLIALCLPLAGMFLLAPALALVAVPQLAFNGLGDAWGFTDPRAHYSSALLPALFAATVFGVKRLPVTYRASAALLVLGLSLGLSLLGGVPGARGTQDLGLDSDRLARRIDALRDGIALVPTGVPVAATNAAGSHLSDRRHVSLVPLIRDAEWIVVERRDAYLAPHIGVLATDRMHRFLSRTRANPNWELVFERDGVLVFRKAASAKS